MASNYTENYGLCQWEATDQVLRTEFNEDNAKVDAALQELGEAVNTVTSKIGKLGNCQIYTTTYTGTGKSGASNPNKLTFPAQPILIHIARSDGVYFAEEFYGSEFINMRAASGAANCPATWTENTVSWYHENNCTNQLNDKDAVYYVISFIAMS